MNLQDDKFKTIRKLIQINIYYFALEEYNLNPNVGSNSGVYKNVYCEYFSQDKYIEFIKKFDIISTKYIEEFNEIMKENSVYNIKQEDIPEIYKRILKSDYFFILNGIDEHATSFLIQKKSKNSFIVYFANSGNKSGVYHKTIINNTINVEAILNFEINKEQMLYFLKLLQISKEYDEKYLYNNVIEFLKTKEFEFNINNPFVSIADNVYNEKNYIEVQFIGSCVYRSIYLLERIFYTIIKKIKLDEQNNYTILKKIFLINDFMDFYDEAISKEDFNEVVLTNTYEFSKNIFDDLLNNIYSDSELYNDVINMIRHKINIIEEKKNKLHKSINVITVNKLFSYRENIYSSIIIEENKDVLVNTGDFYKFIYGDLKHFYLGSDIIRDYDGFQFLKKITENNSLIDEIINFNNNEIGNEKSFSSNQIDIIRDLEKIFNLIKNYKTNVLDPKFFIILALCNRYCKNICESLKLRNKIDYEDLNNVLTNVKLTNKYSMDIVTNFLNDMIHNQGNFLQYLEDNKILFGLYKGFNFNSILFLKNITQNNLCINTSVIKKIVIPKLLRESIIIKLVYHFIVSFANHIVYKRNCVEDTRKTHFINLITMYNSYLDGNYHICSCEKCDEYYEKSAKKFGSEYKNYFIAFIGDFLNSKIFANPDDKGKKLFLSFGSTESMYKEGDDIYINDSGILLKNFYFISENCLPVPDKINTYNGIITNKPQLDELLQNVEDIIYASDSYYHQINQLSNSDTTSGSIKILEPKRVLEGYVKSGEQIIYGGGSNLDILLEKLRILRKNYYNTDLIDFIKEYQSFICLLSEVISEPDDQEIKILRDSNYYSKYLEFNFGSIYYRIYSLILKKFLAKENNILINSFTCINKSKELLEKLKKEEDVYEKSIETEKFSIYRNMIWEQLVQEKESKINPEVCGEYDNRKIRIDLLEKQISIIQRQLDILNIKLTLINEKNKLKTLFNDLEQDFRRKDGKQDIVNKLLDIPDINTLFIEHLKNFNISKFNEYWEKLKSKRKPEYIDKFFKHGPDIIDSFKNKISESKFILEREITDFNRFELQQISSEKRELEKNLKKNIGELDSVKNPKVLVSSKGIKDIRKELNQIRNNITYNVSSINKMYDNIYNLFRLEDKQSLSSEDIIYDNMIDNEIISILKGTNKHFNTSKFTIGKKKNISPINFSSNTEYQKDFIVWGDFTNHEIKVSDSIIDFFIEELGERLNKFFKGKNFYLRPFYKKSTGENYILNANISTYGFEKTGNNDLIDFRFNQTSISIIRDFASKYLIAIPVLSIYDKYNKDNSSMFTIKNLYWETFKKQNNYVCKQYSLPYIIDELSYNINSDIKNINNIDDLIPNFYLLSNTPFKYDTENLIGDKFYYHNYQNNIDYLLNSNILINMESNLKFEDKEINKMYDKLFIIFMYLMYRLCWQVTDDVLFKENILGISDKIITFVDKLKSNIDFLNQKIIKSLFTIINNLLILKTSRNSLDITKTLSVLLDIDYGEISNLKLTINFDPNIFNLIKIQITTEIMDFNKKTNNTNIKQIIDLSRNMFNFSILKTDVELNKLIRYFNINPSTTVKYYDEQYIFTIIGNNMIRIKEIDSTINRYEIKFNNETIIQPSNYNDIPLSIFDSYIIFYDEENNKFRYIFIEKDNSKNILDSIESLDGKLVLKVKVKDKVFNLESKLELKKMLNNFGLENLGSIEQIYLLSDDDKYYIYLINYQDSKIDNMLTIKENKLYFTLNNKIYEYVNNEPVFNYMVGNYNKDIIIGKDKENNITILFFYNCKIDSEGEKPLLYQEILDLKKEYPYYMNILCDYREPNYSREWINRIFTKEKIAQLNQELVDSNYRNITVLEDDDIINAKLLNKHVNKKEKEELVKRIMRISLDRMTNARKYYWNNISYSYVIDTKLLYNSLVFNNEINILRTYFVSACGFNYPITIMTYLELTKTFSLSKWSEYLNFYKGSQVFGEILNFSIKNDEEDDNISGPNKNIKDLVVNKFNNPKVLASKFICNKHLPFDFRLPKSFFNNISSSSLYYTSSVENLITMGLQDKNMIEANYFTNLRKSFTYIDIGPKSKQDISYENIEYLKENRPLVYAELLYFFKIAKQDYYEKQEAFSPITNAFQIKVAGEDGNEFNVNLVYNTLYNYWSKSTLSLNKIPQIKDTSSKITLIDNSKNIKWNILELNNQYLNKYCIKNKDYLCDLSKYLIENNINLSDFNIQDEKIISDIHTGLGISLLDSDIYNSIDEYKEKTSKYSLTSSIADVKAKILEYLNKKIQIINERTELYYNSIEDKININKKNIIFYLNDSKVAEYYFFKTLLLKYTVLKNKIEYPEYNLEENLNLYIKEFLQNPGYIEWDGVNPSFKVNTIVIYFDYYFSYNEFKKSPLRGGTIIRNEQFTLINQIVSSNCLVNTETNFYQLIMGAGKSSYIAPLLTLMLNLAGKVPIHVMPDYLTTPAQENFRILEEFGIKTIFKKINRELESNYMLDEVMSVSNLNIIMSDSSIKSMLLNVVKQKNVGINEILKERLGKSFLLFDEVDDISDPFTCELNYPENSTKRKISLLEERIDFILSILKYFYLRFNSDDDSIIKKSYEIIDTSGLINSYYVDKNIDEKIYTELIQARSEFIIREINNFIQDKDFIQSIDIIYEENNFKSHCNKYLFDKYANRSTDIDFYKFLTCEPEYYKQNDSNLERIGASFISKYQIKNQTEIEYINILVNKNINVSNLTLSDTNKKLMSKIMDEDLLENYVYMINKFNIVYEFMFKILRTVLVSRYRLNYGLMDLEGYQRIKQNLVAIPFKAVENPSMNSEFSNVNITIGYTIASYLSNKYVLRPGDYDFLLNNLKQIFLTSETIEEWFISSAYLEDYLSIIFAIRGKVNYKYKYDINMFGTYNKINDMEIEDEFRNKPNDVMTQIDINKQKNYQVEIFDNYIKNVCGALLEEFVNQLNSTFCDIVSSDFAVGGRSGFSGTPYFISPYDSSQVKLIPTKPVTDVSAEGSIYYSILDPKGSIYQLSTNIKNIICFIKSKNYNAIIDVGAYFLGYSNYSVAKILLNSMKDKHIIYLNDKDEQCFIHKDNIKQEMLVSSENPSYFANKNILVFFDQKHITGIDVKIMPLNAVGIVLLKKSNSLRDYSQGAFRLRKINITQYVDIGVDSIIYEKINKIEPTEPTEPTEQTQSMISTNPDVKTLKNNLLKYLLDSENSKRKSKQNLQAYHNLRTIFRNILLNNGYESIKFIKGIYDYYNESTYSIKSVFNLSSDINNIYPNLDEFNKKEMIYLTDKIKGFIPDNYLTNVIDKLLDLCMKSKTALDTRTQESISEQTSMQISQKVSQKVAEKIAEEEELEEREQEEEQERLIHRQNLIALYDKFNEIEPNYSIEELVKLEDNNLLNIMVDRDGVFKLFDIEKQSVVEQVDKTFIKYDYYDNIYLSKIFIKTFYTNYYIDKNIPFVYKVIYNKVKNKMIVITQDEYVQILSIINKYNIQDIDPYFNLYINFNVGMYAMVDYIVDKELNNNKWIINMINNYILDNKFDTFRKFILKFDFAEIKKDSYQKLKISDDLMLKLILIKSIKPKLDLFIQFNNTGYKTSMISELQNYSNNFYIDKTYESLSENDIIIFYLSRTKLSMMQYIKNNYITMLNKRNNLSKRKIDMVFDIFTSFTLYIQNIIKFNFTVDRYGQEFIKVIIYIIYNSIIDNSLTSSPFETVILESKTRFNSLQLTNYEFIKYLQNEHYKVANKFFDSNFRNVIELNKLLDKNNNGFMIDN